MMSRAYRRSVLTSESGDQFAKDPRNQQLAWFPLRRADFETMRDSALFVSGLLDTSIGGPPAGSATDAGFRRRVIYGRIDRLNLPEQFRTFDFPEANALAVERATTTTPGQALFLMNHPLLRMCAEGLVDRVTEPSGHDDLAVADAMARIVWQRGLTPAERGEIAAFLAAEPGARRDRLVALGQLFLMSNEFHFSD
jgi:hypothetical protein